MWTHYFETLIFTFVPYNYILSGEYHKKSTLNSVLFFHCWDIGESNYHNIYLLSVHFIKNKARYFISQSQE